MRGIQVTGNWRIDGAAAEIAVALRDAGPGQREQSYYDEASRLRDEIMEGTRELFAHARVTGHCDSCLGCLAQVAIGYPLAHKCATPDHQHTPPCEQAAA